VLGGSVSLALQVNESAYESTHTAFGTICKKIAPFQTQFMKLEEIETKASDFQKAADSINELLMSSEKAEAQIRQIAKGSVAKGGGAGVAREAAHFSEEASEHANNSKNWLWGVTLASMVLLIIGAYFYCSPPPEVEGIAWNHFIPKFSILGMLIFIDFMLISVYQAERHNAVVNKHRANALNTFETMTAATLTQDVKDAVTLTAAGAIYAPQDTGYSKKTASARNSAADILSAIGTTKD